jgi:hypothetical protein
MASDGEVHQKMVFFRKFAEKFKNSNMTISEACEKVLRDLGGRAQLPDIYPRVLKLVTFTGATPKNSIRTEMKNHPLIFRHSPNKPKGWWELVSYQEEVAALKKENEELKDSNKRLTSIPKEAEFIERFLDEVMDVYKYDRKKADPIRIIMRTLGHEDAVAVLTAWIDEKEDELAKALEKLKIQIRNITMTGNDATYNENNDKDKDE